MTAIDPHGEIELDSEGDQVIARLPLTRPVAEAWARHYERLAQANDVPARARTDNGRGWIVVQVPADSRAARAADTMNAARDLIAARHAALKFALVRGRLPLPKQGEPTSSP